LPRIDTSRDDLLGARRFEALFLENRNFVEIV
jgi:hypothetical protein